MTPKIPVVRAFVFFSFVFVCLYFLAGAVRDAHLHDFAFPLDLLQPQLVTTKQAPDFTLPDRQGKPLRLSSLKGKPVLLNLWSVSCPPCLEEMPTLMYLDEVARQRQSFQVVTVCAEENGDAVSKIFASSPESKLTVLFDPTRSTIERLYGTTKFPETFLIDPSGNIRARFDGQRNWANPLVINLLEAL